MIKSKHYYLWLCADTFMLVAASIRTFVVPILVLTLGGSATDAATLAAISQIINFIFVLPGGLIVDSHDRRSLMIISEISCIIFFVAFAACLVIFGYNLVLFYLLSIFMSIQNALLGGVSNVMLPSVVSSKELPEAISANQARDNIITMVASPFAAMLLAIANYFPFLMGAAGNLVALLATLGLKPDIPDTAKIKEHADKTLTERIHTSIHEATIGRRMVMSYKVIGLLTLLTTLINPFISGVFTMLIYYVTQTYGVFNASLIDTVIAVSMIVGSLFAGYLTKRFTTGSLTICTLCLIAISEIGVVLAPNFVLKMVFFALAGLMLPSINVIFSTLLMRLIPSAKLGRFNSFSTFISYFVAIPVQFMVGILYDGLSFAIASFIYIGLYALSCSIAFTKELRSIPKATDLDEYIESLKIDL